MNSLISIITPSFNCCEWIGKTYQSLVNQTFKNWQWLITDDCSSDDTLLLLQNLATNDKRIKVFKNVENLGAAVARNNSLAHAIGEYIAFIDSDDIWLPNKLESQLNFMEKIILIFLLLHSN